MSLLHKGKSQTSLDTPTIMKRTLSSNSILSKHQSNNNDNNNTNGISSTGSLSRLSNVNLHNNSSINVTLSPLIKKELNLTNQRLDLGIWIEEFINILGKESWIKYAQVISLFILGKLSRIELVKQLDQLFEENVAVDNDGTSSNNSTSSTINKDSRLTHEQRHKLTRLHNQLLLGIFANSLRDSPMNKSNKAWGFQNGDNSTSKNMKRVNKHNSQIEMYKKIVMSLPKNDRNRLKTITREAGKRGFIYCTVLQNRLHNVPKIPIVTNQETLKRVKKNNLKTPLEWSQDIVNGFNAPLSIDSYSLPDNDTLILRMTGVAREHGLVGSVDSKCVDMVSIALDHYLKKIIELGIDSVRYRRKKYSEYYDLNDEGLYVPVSGLGMDFISTENVVNTGNKNNDEQEKSLIIQPKMSLTNEDIQTALTIFPNLVEPSTGIFQTLTSIGLYNDDELVETRSSIDDLPQFNSERPSSKPIDDRNIGTREELNWLIKDILNEE